MDAPDDETPDRTMDEREKPWCIKPFDCFVYNGVGVGVEATEGFEYSTSFPVRQDLGLHNWDFQSVRWLKLSKVTLMVGRKATVLRTLETDKHKLLQTFLENGINPWPTVGSSVRHDRQ
ncbi:unnamed protein product [Peronospora belbahrii]|uniref:Uncharacterized protein n=1 Tax=Peronospora belbahrii TaxID=622444 RepID=A0ABN8CY73_9STRA|nr:unnamed protein product [Peronospora belbahrii]